MILQVEFTWLVGLLMMFFVAVWAFGKVLVGQFDKRLDERFMLQESIRTENKADIDQRFNQLETLARKTEYDVQNLSKTLPAEYVRREDWIRFSVGIDNKFDTIYNALTDIREKLHD